MRVIPDWTTKDLRCHFCGDHRSVKYEVDTDETTSPVPVCSSCVLHGILERLQTENQLITNKNN